MITFCHPIENNFSAAKDIDRNINRLCILLAYDIATIIHFNGENKIVASKKVFIKKDTKYINYKKEWVKVVNQSSKNMLSLIRNKKEIIIYSRNDKDDDEYKPLINSASSEIYIPIFSEKQDSKNLLACIYLAKIDNKDTILKIEDIMQKEISDTICNIARLYQIIYLRKQRNKSILNLINIMSEITREKEPFMILHPYHVAQLTTEIGKSLGLDEEKTKKIYLASILHDIGKIYLDGNVLNKKGSLTEKEYGEMKNHSVYGANIIKDVTGLADISFIIRHHHERYDGTGYPDGLKGEEIPLESRMICVADAVDAMLSHRSYRNSQGIDFVIRELLKNRGKQFDPKLVDVMVKLLTRPNNEITGILSDSIVWGTLVISMREKVYSVEGTLGKYEFGYFFKADKFNFLSEIDKSDITSVNLYINKSKNIIQYQLKLDYFEENIVRISELKYIETKDSFSILWKLIGKLKLNNHDVYEVNICKLGGTSLTLFLDKKGDKAQMKNKVASLEILFENNKTISINGRITKAWRVTNVNYYEFTYIDINKSITDQIFRQMFEKQMQMKRLVSKLM